MRWSRTDLLLGKHLQEQRLLRLQYLRCRWRLVHAFGGNLQRRLVQQRGLRRPGQTLLPDGDQHDPNLLHRPRYEVCIRRLRPVRKQRR